MLASTVLISCAPNPVAVRLCLGREMPDGPTGPLRSTMGADVLGRRSWPADLVAVAVVELAMVAGAMFVESRR
jgi:hypothetical protein